MFMSFLTTYNDPKGQPPLTDFYLAHRDGFFRYALFLMKDPHKAEDLLSAAWLTWLECQETFRSIPPQKQAAWMVAVIRNTAFTTLAREGRLESLDSTDWDLMAPECCDPQQVQSYQDLVSLIRSMPEQYRMILELKFLREWSDRQIADYTGLTVGAVSTRISRGRKLLQEILRKEGYHP